MLRLIDTYYKIIHHFPDGKFNLPVWRKYVNAISPGLAAMVEHDSSTRLHYVRAVVPVVQSALSQREAMHKIHETFERIGQQFSPRYTQVFGEDLDVDIILYLGLCNGAGWAAQVNRRATVLLGIEKIIELDWGSEEKLFSLIAHEVGHIWHMQMVDYFDTEKNTREKAIFQLYSEGVAMYCEQLLIGDESYYHQNKNDWLEWCEANVEDIKQEYLRRVNASESIQDFFGDWCSYRAHSDVGYFLGCQFVKALLQSYPLSEVACLPLQQVDAAFVQYANTPGISPSVLV